MTLLWLRTNLVQAPVSSPWLQDKARHRQSAYNLRHLGHGGSGHLLCAAWRESAPHQQEGGHLTLSTTCPTSTSCALELFHWVFLHQIQQSSVQPNRGAISLYITNGNRNPFQSLQADTGSIQLNFFEVIHSYSSKSIFSSSLCGSVPL